MSKRVELLKAFNKSLNDLITYQIKHAIQKVEKNSTKKRKSPEEVSSPSSSKCGGRVENGASTGPCQGGKNSSVFVKTREGLVYCKTCDGSNKRLAAKARKTKNQDTKDEEKIEEK
jgi:hypothetical protein